MYLVVDGKPQQETNNGVVVLSFDTEYSIAFKNKHNKRALVKFKIDGEDASGAGYIIPAGETITVERFHDIAKKFLFVDSKSDKAIEDGKNHSGSYQGKVEATFCLEADYNSNYPYNYPLVQPTPWNGHYPGIRYGGTTLSRGSCSSQSYSALNSALQSDTDYLSAQATMDCCVPKSTASCNVASINLNAVQVGAVENGVTVEGSASDQTFQSAYFNAGTDYTNVTILIKGVQRGVQLTAVNGEVVHVADTLLADETKTIRDEIAKLEAQKAALLALEKKRAELVNLKIKEDKLRAEIADLTLKS